MYTSPRSPKHRERNDRRRSNKSKFKEEATRALRLVGELDDSNGTGDMHPNAFANTSTSTATAAVLRFIQQRESRRDARIFKLRRVIRSLAATISSLTMSLRSASGAHKNRLRDLKSSNRYIAKLERKLNLLATQAPEEFKRVSDYLDQASRQAQEEARAEAKELREARHRLHVQRQVGRVTFLSEDKEQLPRFERNQPTFELSDTDLQREVDDEPLFDDCGSERDEGFGRPSRGGRSSGSSRNEERGRSVGTPGQKGARPRAEEQHPKENALLGTAILDEDVDRNLTADELDFDHSMYLDESGVDLDGFGSDEEEEMFDFGEPTVLVKDGKATDEDAKKRSDVVREMQAIYDKKDRSAMTPAERRISERLEAQMAEIEDIRTLEEAILDLKEHGPTGEELEEQSRKEAPTFPHEYSGRESYRYDPETRKLVPLNAAARVADAARRSAERPGVDPLAASGDASREHAGDELPKVEGTPQERRDVEVEPLGGESPCPDGGFHDANDCVFVHPTPAREQAFKDAIQSLPVDDPTPAPAAEGPGDGEKPCTTVLDDGEREAMARELRGLRRPLYFYPGDENDLPPERPFNTGGIH